MSSLIVMSQNSPYPAHGEPSKTGLFSLAGLATTRHNDAKGLVLWRLMDLALRYFCAIDKIMATDQRTAPTLVP